MGEDVYQLCSCGSGKKYKICCYSAVKDGRAFDSCRASFETYSLAERTWVGWLQQEWEQINYNYRLKLLKPQIIIAPSQTKHGHWDPVTKTIMISHNTIRTYPWHIVVDILKHEMAHQYVSERHLLADKMHGVEFKHLCQRMGLSEWAQSASGGIPHHVPDWRESALSEDEKRLIDKTNKLLALAQSDNEHEASLAMQRVRELYTKYNLDQVEARQESKFVSWVLNFKRKRIESWQSIILVILGRHFFVKTITFAEYDPIDLVEYKAAEILGKKENVLMAEYVYHFLENTVHSLWNKYLREKIQASCAPKRRLSLQTERRHFMIGVLNGVMIQLDKIKVYQQAGSRSESQCMSLIEISDQELNQFYRKRYPRISTRPAAQFDSRSQTYQSGISEGEKIRLHKPMAHQDGYQGLLLES